ncbi:holo-ACP synthase [Gemmatimonas sp.]|uniref:holo-ACP synthase n=1 Tax=Gemmatimonas sp. TaxID=1962908 RepID=UPI0031C0CBB2|nr:holo-ACP synthase [Gemmatimonas sp.]
MTGMPMMRVGVDLVRVRDVTESVNTFGDRYLQRLFTPAELSYARGDPTRMPERLAARFAAKEATIKALGMAEHEGAWRCIEVIRTASGRCELLLHGRVRVAADALGATSLAISLSHEHEYAAAVVVAAVHRLPNA